MKFKNIVREICNAINEKFDDNIKMRNTALQSIESTINSMADYMSSVISMESALQIAKFRMEGEDYRDYIQTLDRRRTSAHNAMIARVSSANRICDMVGCKKFFGGDIDDRYAVADFAGDVVKEFFDNRSLKGKGLKLGDLLGENAGE